VIDLAFSYSADFYGAVIHSPYQTTFQSLASVSDELALQSADVPQVLAGEAVLEAVEAGVVI
jgi:hypothetical protein